MTTLFRSPENRFLAAFSFLFSLNTLLFVSREVEALDFLAFTRDTSPFYFCYAALLIATAGTLTYFSETFQWRAWLSKVLIVLFPAEVLLTFGLFESKHFHYIFAFAAGAYIVLAGTAILASHHVRRQAPAETALLAACKAWFRAQGGKTLFLLLLVMALNFGFGVYRLAQFGAVDEPLWTFGRIQRFWTNFAEHDWNGTRISDKPGITVAVISGAGLLFENPKEYKPVKVSGGTEHSLKDIERLNFALRFPILLFTVLMLPVFYFFLERLLGREKALFSTIFIGTSPILLGMARIINPDSLLWTFAPLSVLSYLVFLKRNNLWYLYASGVFLGFALLTKYVANIVFVFLFGLIFLEYVFMKRNAREGLDTVRYFKQSFLHYVGVTFVSLSVFYLLYPATWVRPSRLLDATLLSQAFESTWPLFIGILAFIFLDQWLLRNRISAALLDLLGEKKHWLTLAIGGFFALSACLAFANTYAGMPWYRFEDILASPKTAYLAEGFGSVFFANFYPLLFGISPLALVFAATSVVFLLRKPGLAAFSSRASLYLILFILLYYLGSTVNHVAAISRYQIILFPLMLVLAGIGAGHVLTAVRKKYPRASLPLAASLVLLSTAVSLADIAPFHLGYASGFLPKQYHIDIKDMGTGSYEAAAYLNSLPSPERITIWTDKNGVCAFFRGNCYSSLNFAKLREKGLDYIVVSSGRQSRTTKMMQSHIPNPELKDVIIRFDQYYDKADGTAFKVEIDGRPGDYVKVFPFDGATSVTGR
jgi:4-amino-4-deoxy-L-arabinose transferase-like glycosyltransferase